MDIKDLEERVKTAETNGMVRINIRHDDGCKESIWACFVAPNDKASYDKTDESFTVFLMNHALIGCPSWGGRLKLQSNGGNRALIEVGQVISQLEDAVESGDYPASIAWE